MAKKLGKIVLFTAAAASIATAVYYFMQKKEQKKDVTEEEDYDDFSDDTDKASESSRNYVPLNSDAAEGGAAAETASEGGDGTTTENASEGGNDMAAETASESVDNEKKPEDTFTPLAEQVSQAAEQAVETVEEFFDEEDGTDEEPPINDSTDE